MLMQFTPVAELTTGHVAALKPVTRVCLKPGTGQ